MKICLVGDVIDVITCAKFKNEIFRGYNFTGNRILHFPIDFWMGLTTVQRYCAACDYYFYENSHNSTKMQTRTTSVANKHKLIPSTWHLHEQQCPNNHSWNLRRILNNCVLDWQRNCSNVHGMTTISAESSNTGCCYWYLNVFLFFCIFF